MVFPSDTAVMTTARTLSQDQVLNGDPARFGDEGYCVYRGLLAPEEIAACRAALDRTIAERPDARWERLTEPHVRDDFWLRLCAHPRILDAVASVLGDDLVLLMSHLIVKPPHDGLAVEWHQDKPYWKSVRGTDIVTVWLAIDDADRENGCMEVLPRTQAEHQALPMVKTDGSDLLGVRVEVDATTESSRLPVELRAGDASIHDAHIIHGSRANRSPRRRAGYTMRYGSARTTHVDVASHWVPVWQVRGEPPAWSGWKDAR
jgi:ectoine hydroxylase-related dioxygenase (phytanoyl-CoA dioxygenase family)